MMPTPSSPPRPPWPSTRLRSSRPCPLWPTSPARRALTEVLERRAINAANRVGRAEDAAGLASVATRSDASKNLRVESLAILAAWAKPAGSRPDQRPLAADRRPTGAGRRRCPPAPGQGPARRLPRRDPPGHDRGRGRAGDQGSRAGPGRPGRLRQGQRDGPGRRHQGPRKARRPEIGRCRRGGHRCGRGAGPLRGSPHLDQAQSRTGHPSAGHRARSRPGLDPRAAVDDRDPGFDRSPRSRRDPGEVAPPARREAGLSRDRAGVARRRLEAEVGPSSSTCSRSTRPVGPRTARSPDTWPSWKGATPNAVGRSTRTMRPSTASAATK